MKLALFRRSPRPDTIAVLYGMIVAQARLPTFYRDYGVSDTVNGRFDMIVLHMALFLRRLASENTETKAFGQGVFDAFCRDMDDNLREIGIGDLSVPKEMYRMADAFYGRTQAYEAALAAEGELPLVEAIGRNIFAQGAAPPQGAKRLAAYVRKAAGDLAAQNSGAFARAELRFPDPANVAVAAAIL
jgi:cytochrome b pre-mRNA-processing protein 3